MHHNRSFPFWAQKLSHINRSKRNQPSHLPLPRSWITELGFQGHWFTTQPCRELTELHLRWQQGCRGQSLRRCLGCRVAHQLLIWEVLVRGRGDVTHRFELKQEAWWTTREPNSSSGLGRRETAETPCGLAGALPNPGAELGVCTCLLFVRVSGRKV